MLEHENKRISAPYKWSSVNTAEQREDPYISTPESKSVTTRLQLGEGNILTVIANQGVGKTALHNRVDKELKDNGDFVISCKWVGWETGKYIERQVRKADGEVDAEDSHIDSVNPTIIKIVAGIDKLFCEWLEENPKENGLFAIALSRAIYTPLMKREGMPKPVADKIHEYMTAMCDSKALAEKLRKELATNYWSQLQDFLKKVNPSALDEPKTPSDNTDFGNITINLDMLDYDRHERKRLSDDLSTIWSFFEKFSKIKFRHFTGLPNLVLFIQKELFATSGHFFIGKMTRVELKLFSSEVLVAYYRDRVKPFGCIAPFTESALREVTVLAHGNMRHYKRYVNRCLTSAIDRKPVKVTLQDVVAWITTEDIAEDRKLELCNLFPKSSKLRVKVVEVLRLLDKNNGSLQQQAIARDVFNGKEMRASRFLRRLESANYITREIEGKGFNVKLVV